MSEPYRNAHRPAVLDHMMGVVLSPTDLAFGRQLIRNNVNPRASEGYIQAQALASACCANSIIQAMVEFRPQTKGNKK